MDDESIQRVEELVDFAPLRLAVREALGSLTPKLADAVVLRVGLGLPYGEVARRLGCSQGAARVRVARGLDQLSGQLEVTR
jgi:RNA polymerase sigma factor (sigma-70 family)